MSMSLASLKKKSSSIDKLTKELGKLKVAPVAAKMIVSGNQKSTKQVMVMLLFAFWMHPLLMVKIPCPGSKYSIMDSKVLVVG